VERQNLDLIIDHLSVRIESETKGRRVTQLPALASAVQKLCARFQAHGERRYSKIAAELPAIAADIGVSINPERLISDQAFMEEIERGRIEIGRHVRSYLAPAFLEWIYVTDPATANALLLDTGFDPNQLIEPNSSWEIGSQGSSRLDLRAAIRTARSRLILIAQNHWFMISAEKEGNLQFWPLLTEAMARGVDVDIIAMHPEISSSGLPIAGDELPEPDAIALWSLYMGAPQIGRQIDACWTTFAEWDDMYDEFSAKAESPVGNLRIFGAYFTPLTMTIVDPDEDDGYLVLSPRAPDNKSVARPQFEIHKRKEPYAFGYYYGDVQFQLVNDFWVKIHG
jgi:hypothetical protein